MERQFYLDLARSGLRMPIGTDLVLHEQTDPELIKHDGAALGNVVAAAARRYRTPLAIPLMDLTLEKEDLESLVGDLSAADAVDRMRAAAGAPFPERNRAHIESVAWVARNTGLLAAGMAIGPFSLMTRLMTDPITAVALAGMGVEDDSVRLARRCLALAEIAVERAVRAQIGAGAKLVVLCEPAANRVYISPKQLQAGSDVFETFVMQPQLRLAAILKSAGADLMFHDCGELTTDMVREFATRLHPVILSLGSSRKLWEDAAVVPKDVVLFGNLPTKHFYSDEATPLEKVAGMVAELRVRMCAAGHPHILGSECDVLHVPEAADRIRRKVELMLAHES